jgi:5-methylcytosine-specific restriction endonuclease McrA
MPRRLPIDLKTSEGRKKFYQSPEWKCLRRVKLTSNPWCEKCNKEHGLLQPAEDVHHIVDLKDDPTKCLEYSNLMSLCKPCHSGITFTGLNRRTEYEIVNRKWKV